MIGGNIRMKMHIKKLAKNAKLIIKMQKMLLQKKIITWCMD